MAVTIYLDQNKWIDLARAKYQKKGGQEFEKVLEIILNRVSGDDLILPMSVVHFIETARSLEKNRRMRLATFMAQVSNGNGILPFNAIRDTEVQQAVLKKLDIDIDYSIKDIVIGHGADFILGSKFELEGVPKNIQSKILLKIDHEELIVKFLTESISDQTSLDIKKEDEEVLSGLEEMRRKQQAELSKEMRLRLAITEMSYSINPMIIKYLHQLNIDVKEFVKLLKTPDDWKSFFFSIPTMDIWINLNVKRDNDLSRKIHRNDTNDIAFLSIAVPYCDIVVVEKYWAHILNNSNLASKYDCVVLDSLNDLHNYI